MVRRSLALSLIGVTALVLAGCSGANEVAVEDPPTPATASPQTRPAPAEPASPAQETTSADRGPGALGAEPAAPPPSAAGEDVEVDDPPPPAADPEGGPADTASGNSSGSADVEPAGEVADVDERPGADEAAHVGRAPAIAIARPAAGSDHAGGPVTAEGEATVYEGTVLLTLIGPNGSVVEESFTTATAGAPERGRWSHTFTVAADEPGRWRVVAAATDPSDGEGAPPARTEASFQVTGSR